MLRTSPPRSTPTVGKILKILRADLPELRQRYGIKALGIFGSYLRGEQRRDSDVDLLVEFDDRSLTLLQFIALENELTDRLGVKVDLVEKQMLKPKIGHQILQEVQML